MKEVVGMLCINHHNCAISWCVKRVSETNTYSTVSYNLYCIPLFLYFLTNHKETIKLLLFIYLILIQGHHQQYGEVEQQQERAHYSFLFSALNRFYLFI